MWKLMIKLVVLAMVVSICSCYPFNAPSPVCTVEDMYGMGNWEEKWKREVEYYSWVANGAKLPFPPYAEFDPTDPCE